LGATSALDEVEARALEAQFRIAILALKEGDAGEAARRLEAIVGRASDWFEAWHNLGFARQVLGMWPQAAAAYQAALAARPASQETVRALAVALSVVGRGAEAIALYRNLANDPSRRAFALTRIALVDPGAISIDEQVEMTKAARAPTTDPQTRIGLLFALGQVLEAAGRYDSAFAALARGNRLKRADLVRRGALHPERAAREHAASIASLKAWFSAEFIAESQGRGHPTAAPIFVVGMPRSGSTLLEQILSSHSEVEGLGETNALIKTIGGQFPFHRTAAPLERHFARLADDYLEAVRPARHRASPRFVDKMLDNYLHIGMIHLLFPRAVILHSIRDPLDTCLSIYRQLFTGEGNECCYDLADIGGEYARYRQMMAHWQAVLPGRVVEISHEVLVDDPQTEIRRLITEVCGLPWEEGCLSFHQSDHPVSSASSLQVRQPIGRSSLGRWRAYRRHLGPLKEALGPYAPQDA